MPITVVEVGGKIISIGGGLLQTGSASPPPVTVPGSQIKFPNGHMMATGGGAAEYGSINNNTTTTGPWFNLPQYQGELQLLKAYHNGLIGYVMCATARSLENYAATTNLALTPAASGGAAGATGSALQTAINTQYPGFASNIQQQFYYQQAISPGDLFGIILNTVYLSPGNWTNAVITQDWTWTVKGSQYPVVPRDLMNCGGTITVPNSYGSTTSTVYNVDPIYSGSNGYGFGFANLNGSAFNFAIPAWWNPGVNQRQHIQIWQALSQFTFTGGASYNNATAYAIGNPVLNGGVYYICTAATTGHAPPNSSFWMVNPFVGQTLNGTNLIIYMTHNDELSWNMNGSQNISGGQVVNPPYHSAAPAATDANFFSGWQAFFNARVAAFPNIHQGDCYSDGFRGTDDGQIPNTNVLTAEHVNNLISGNGLTAIRGYAWSRSDVFYNMWNLNSWTFPQASYAEIALIGNNPPPVSSPSTGQIVHVSQYDETGLAFCVGNVQGGDFGPPQPSPSGPGQPAGFTQAGIAAMIQSANYLDMQLMLWSASDAAGITDPTNPSGAWQTYIQPGIVAAQASTPLTTLLPLYDMYGPPIVLATSTGSSATINWNAITGQGTGLSIILYRNGAQIASGSAGSFITYTDNSYTYGSSYTLAMSNANGTGPQGASVSPSVLNPTDFTWTPSVSAGVTGYNIGIRLSSGTVGVYPINVAVAGQYTSYILLTDIIPPLASGAYVWAIQAVGSGGVGAWSGEQGFIIS